MAFDLLIRGGSVVDGSGSPPVLADVAVGLMGRVVAPVGRLVTRLPVGPERPGMTAGPSFELFYETDYLMPHRQAAWALLEERLRDAVAFYPAAMDACHVDDEQVTAQPGGFYGGWITSDVEL